MQEEPKYTKQRRQTVDSVSRKEQEIQKMKRARARDMIDVWAAVRGHRLPVKFEQVTIERENVITSEGTTKTVEKRIPTNVESTCPPVVHEVPTAFEVSGGLDRVLSRAMDRRRREMEETGVDRLAEAVKEQAPMKMRGLFKQRDLELMPVHKAISKSGLVAHEVQVANLVDNRIRAFCWRHVPQFLQMETLPGIGGSCAVPREEHEEQIKYWAKRDLRVIRSAVHIALLLKHPRFGRFAPETDARKIVVPDDVKEWLLAGYTGNTPSRAARQKLSSLADDFASFIALGL